MEQKVYSRCIDPGCPQPHTAKKPAESYQAVELSFRLELGEKFGVIIRATTGKPKFDLV